MSDLAEIRSILFELKEDMGGVRADVAAMNRTMTERGTRMDAVERRVGKVENTMHFWAGGGTLGGFLVGLVVHYPFK